MFSRIKNNSKYDVLASQTVRKAGMTTVCHGNCPKKQSSHTGFDLKTLIFYTEEKKKPHTHTHQLLNCAKFSENHKKNNIHSLHIKPHIKEKT